MFRRNRTDEPDYVRAARKKVRAKKWFYRHFSVYGVIILFLACINILDSAQSGYYEMWFLYPALSWGVLVAIHYLFLFGLPFTKVGTREWEEQELAREIQRRAPQEPQPIAALPPEQEPEGLDIDEHLKLREVAKKKQKSPVYRTDDLVYHLPTQDRLYH